MLTVEGVCEERGEGFGVLDCFSSAGRQRLNKRELMLRILLNCRGRRSNPSCSRADSKGMLATEAPSSSCPSNEGHL